MSDQPAAFPLQWPVGRPRCKARQSGRFATTRQSHGGAIQPVTIAEARDRLQNELDRLGARQPILSSNLVLNLNGAPRSGQPEPRDPGVAVYFQLKGRPMVLCCDRFTETAQNIAALAAHIEATRRIERYGVATTEQMFDGFLALPAPIVVNDWRAALDNPTSLAEAEATWKRKIRAAHPDVGGSEAEAARINAAFDEAKRAFV